MFRIQYTVILFFVIVIFDVINSTSVVTEKEFGNVKDDSVTGNSSLETRSRSKRRIDFEKLISSVSITSLVNRNSSAVVCEGHSAESSEEEFSSGDELSRDKRSISDHSDVELTDNSDEGTDQPHSSRQKRSYHHHKRRRFRKSSVVMPDRKSYNIIEPDATGWVCGTTPTKMIPLSPTGKMSKVEYDLVLKQFKDAVHYPVNYQVQKIEKIVNGCTWKRYKRCCNKIKTEAGVVNERMLFHGTGAFQAILDTGFDERYASNGLYGFGVYFSPLSSKSNGYTPADATGNKHMFLCRVALGKVFRAPTFHNYYHPPAGYNAVEGTVIPATNDCVEMIVFRGEQAYPQYLITYK